ncbi:MAG: class II fructose-bisphosphate aldolase [Patescibacteria group bacterium]|nr:class II fructose-bisphosphate aldolase family protein [Patescibacteria group bacterium]MDE1946121.1 class II fructose-bisphosphate aldolase [Patescibacteria group bacterium]
MKTLRQYIKEAGEKGIAIGHFNIANLEMLHGIVNAARKLDLPVVIGAAEGERKFMGTKEIAALVKTMREEYGHPLFLNADHTYSFELVKECIDAGYDSVIFDGSKLPFDENVKITKRCVDYARKVNPEIIVEGELGFIGSGSTVWKEIPAGVKITEEFLTKPEEAVDFIKKTGVDMLAPAVGNIHGMLAGGKDPALNIPRVAAIKKTANIPLVLHGASGNSKEDIQAAIKAGMNEVHVSTEIRVAFRKALEDEMKAKPDEVAPYKYMDGDIAAVEAVVTEKLKIFNFLP